MTVLNKGILLVDDHPLIIDGLANMLNKKDIYTIINTAENGLVALDIIKENMENIDLVISDISMPKMNGIELCKAIKTTYSAIKVVILTMHNDVSIIKEVIEAEADGYMLKNINQEDFLNGIQRVLDNGTYFSQDILPNIINQYPKEKIQRIILSQREKEVLELIMSEFTSKEIADKLYISKQTVDTHRMNIMQKTNSKTLVGLIKYALTTQS